MSKVNIKVMDQDMLEIYNGKKSKLQKRLRKEPYVVFADIRSLHPDNWEQWLKESKLTKLSSGTKLYSDEALNQYKSGIGKPREEWDNAA